MHTLFPHQRVQSRPSPGCHLALWPSCLLESYIFFFQSYCFSFSIQLLDPRAEHGEGEQRARHRLMSRYIFHLLTGPLWQVWLGFLLWFSQQCPTAGPCSCGVQGGAMPLLGWQLLPLKHWFSGVHSTYLQDAFGVLHPLQVVLLG